MELSPCPTASQTASEIPLNFKSSFQCRRYPFWSEGDSNHVLFWLTVITEVVITDNETLYQKAVRKEEMKKAQHEP